MTVLMGLDQHRAQITGDWIDTDTGEVRRGRKRARDTARFGRSHASAGVDRGCPERRSSCLRIGPAHRWLSSATTTAPESPSSCARPARAGVGPLATQDGRGWRPYSGAGGRGGASPAKPRCDLCSLRNPQLLEHGLRTCDSLAPGDARRGSCGRAQAESCPRTTGARAVRSFTAPGQGGVL